MTNRTKFEAMLEALLNEDQQRARDLFHQIVVEKSRKIYENLLAEDFGKESDEDDSEMDDSDDMEDEDEDEEESDEDSSEFDTEESEDDDSWGDEEVPEFDSEDDDSPVTRGDLEGLEAELGELKSMLQQVVDDMGDEDMDMGDEDMEGDMDMGDEDMEGDMGDEDMEGDMDMGDEDMEGGMGNTMGGMQPSPSKPAAPMMEYVNKVNKAKMGDNGKNTKSPLAKKRANFGGTTANIVKGGTAGPGMKKPQVKESDFGNVNVPGNKKAPQLKAVGKLKKAEKAPNPKSPTSGVKNRNR